MAEKARAEGIASKEADPRFSGSSLDAELAKAAAAFAEGGDNVDEVLPPVEAPPIGLPLLPTVLPQEDVLVKEDAPVAITSMPVLPPDLQVSRLPGTRVLIKDMTRGESGLTRDVCSPRCRG